MRRLISILLALLICISLLPGPATAAPASQFFPQTGYAVADSGQARFLGEFQRLGGVTALGYPVSDPFVFRGFTYQLFQRAALQWRPEANQAYLANVMDWLSEWGKDDYLASIGIPRPLVDKGGSWEQAVAERESWLTEAAAEAETASAESGAEPAPDESVCISNPQSQTQER